MTKDLLESWFSSAATVYFQPIFVIAELEPFAFEALSRGPVGTAIESAGTLFELVRLTQQEVRADRHCIDAALRIASRVDSAPTIALNVHPTTLERDPAFAEYLAATLARERIDPRRIILEVLEEPCEIDVQRVARAVRELREEGVRIALDDVGAGLWNYRVIPRLAPDLLKIDRHVVNGCSTDGNRRQVLRAICQLAADIGADLVAEGIERSADLEVVDDLGIPFGQGYFLSHPRPFNDVFERPLDLRTPIRETPKEMHACSERRSSSWMTPTRF